MGNKNFNGFANSAKELGLEVQLITGTHKNCVIAMLCQGYKFERLSQLNCADARELLEDIKCNGVAKAYEHHNYGKTSVCKQLVNDAHGRYREESERHGYIQDGTYANRFEQIQLYKRNLYDVLVMACGLDKDVKDLHKEYTWEDFAKAYISINYGNKKLDIQDIKDNYIIVDEKVISINNLLYVIDMWIKENKITKEFSREEKIKAIRGFEKARELQAV